MLTNNGPLVNDLELQLKKHLKLKHLLYISDGAITLQIAMTMRRLSLADKLLQLLFFM
jgi:hypothetical protein